MSSASPPQLTGRRLTAIPDTLDFRDLMFVPTLIEVPARRPLESYTDAMGDELRILDQGVEGACTGYALAAVAHYLLTQRVRSGGAPPDEDLRERRVSPWMLYHTAKRYDEWPGESYSGSSARGAMKGWHKHGVCRADLWTGSGSASGPAWARRWDDAQRRPLGAYFRVNHRDLVAMHAAITEVGALYATGLVHEGWSADQVTDGRITFSSPRAGGHAFAIVGYDLDGFWIQNSWGDDWGSKGFAHLSYDDWLTNGLDVWVARLGAPVRTSPTRTSVSAGPAGGGVRHNDLRAHVVSIGNDGRLRASGTWGTDEAEVRRIIGHDLKTWLAARGPDEPAHLLLYAHGGLVSETTAIQRLSDVRGPLLERGIYPLSFVWKSDFWSTLGNILRDALGQRRAEGPFDRAKDFMLDRLDDLLAPVARQLLGKAQWDEMKENALLATAAADGGARIAAQALAGELGPAIESGRIRVHVVAHSAGAVFMAPLLRLLTGSRESYYDFVDLRTGSDSPVPDPRFSRGRGLGLEIASCALWAPACTMSVFARAYLPLVDTAAIRQFGLFTLTDDAERDDHCARIYNKSLLYLVSHAFEARPRIPVIRPEGEALLGLERSVRAPQPDLFGGEPLERLIRDSDRMFWVRAPTPSGTPVGRSSSSTSHGAFDDDDATLQSTLATILEAGVSRRSAVAQARATDFRFDRSPASRRDRRRSLDTH